MALPISGQISYSTVLTELGAPAASQLRLSSASARELANKPSGTIALSNMYNKGRYYFDANLYSTQTGTKSGSTYVVNPVVGFFLYGPYVTLPAGSYTFSMYGTITNSAGYIGNADVVTGFGATVILSQAISTNMFAAGVIWEGSFVLATSTLNVEVRLQLQNTTSVGTFTNTVLRKTG